MTGLPLAILSPLLGLQFGLDGHTQIVLALSLLAGTPVLSLIGAIGGALAGAARRGVLLSLLVLPLAVPVLSSAPAQLNGGDRAGLRDTSCCRRAPHRGAALAPWAGGCGPRRVGMINLRPASRTQSR